MALPSGYTQLSYIESTGTQYIDLNLNWSLYHAIVVDGEILSFDDTVRLVGILDGRGSYNLMYSMGAWRSSDFGNNFILSVGLGNTAPAAFTSSYSSGRHVWSAALTPGTGVGTMTFKIDGLTVDSGEYFSGTTGSNVSYYLFGSHLVNSSQSILWQSGNMRIYEAKITNVQTGTVLRHLYPAKRDADGVLGMYDTANDQFYTNAGTGTFVEGPSPTGTYTVTVTSGGNGTATASPASGVTGTEVTLTATPNTGYELSRWEVLSGGVTITGNKFTIGTADVSIRAVFEAVQPTTYTVTVISGGNGTASASPQSGVSGTTVTLTATPNSGYVFSSWEVLAGGVTISNNSFAIGTANVTVRANFAASGEFLPPPSISVPAVITKGDTYTISWEASPSPGVSYYFLQRYVNGSAYSTVDATSGLSLTDTAQEEWTSVQYRVRAVSTDLQQSAWTTSPVKSVLDPSTTYTVTVSTDGNGTASASPASGVTGTEVTLISTPNEGYVFYTWEVLSGGVTITANKFTIGTADVSIRAVFAPIAPTTYTVTMSTDGHGTATATPSSGSTGTEVVLQATPNNGYRFLSWTVLSGGVTINNNRFTIGTADVSIRANFEEHVAPDPITYYQQLQTYLKNLVKPFKKVVRLEFLQPDDTVAFALGGIGQKFRIPGRDTRTFLQSGSVSVNLANGSRRKASVVLANRDGSFDYAVNKLWFGQRLRISMGMRLPDGEDFYFPMGVFYVENPSALFSPGERTTTLNLTDKWAYLDGTLFGNLEAAYSVDAGTNIYSAIDSLLQMSKYTGTATTDVQNMIDPTPAAYTPYFNGKTYYANRSDGSISSNIAMTDTPYTITENRGSTMGSLILKLNEMLAGWIGYDATGALRLEPSQDDIDDADKPVLFAFTPENSVLLSHSSVSENTAVYNDVTIAGQGLTEKAVWARAVNADPASDTNINLIGRRVLTEEKSDYWNTEQCEALAKWILKRKTVLQKSVTIECGQMFHLVENRLISVKRTDKPGSPVEKHLIQGFTVPIGETGSMSITATSVTDIPDFTITTSVSG